MYCVSLLYFIIVRLYKLKTLRLLAQRSYYFAVYTDKIPIFARSSDIHYLIIANFSIQKSLILALAKLCLQQLWSVTVAAERPDRHHGCVRTSTWSSQWPNWKGVLNKNTSRSHLHIDNLPSTETSSVTQQCIRWILYIMLESEGLIFRYWVIMMYCVSLLYFIILLDYTNWKHCDLLLAQRSYYFAVHTHKIPIFARLSDVHYLIITNFSIQKSLILALAKLCLQQLWLKT